MAAGRTGKSWMYGGVTSSTLPGNLRRFVYLFKDIFNTNVIYSAICAELAYTMTV